MCMDIGKKDVLKINRGFGGNLRDDSSLDYALDKFNDKRLGIYKKIAYFLRAIVVDHPFSDGNKRTATYFALKFAHENKKKVNTELLALQIVSIAKNSIHDIRKIERRIKNAIK